MENKGMKEGKGLLRNNDGDLSNNRIALWVCLVAGFVFAALAIKTGSVMAENFTYFYSASGLLGHGVIKFLELLPKVTTNRAG